jgi:hypothetical protein
MEKTISDFKITEVGFQVDAAHELPIFTSRADSMSLVVKAPVLSVTTKRDGCVVVGGRGSELAIRAHDIGPTGADNVRSISQ